MPTNEWMIRVPELRTRNPEKPNKTIAKLSND